MTKEMKALAKTTPAPGLDLIRAPVPEIGPDDVLIKINKTGICGTDIHIWDWDEWAAKTVPVPLITGHEFAGEIVFLGKHFYLVDIENSAVFQLLQSPGKSVSRVLFRIHDVVVKIIVPGVSIVHGVGNQQQVTGQELRELVVIRPAVHVVDIQVHERREE